jgi:hypothetical protein
MDYKRIIALISGGKNLRREEKIQSTKFEIRNKFKISNHKFKLGAREDLVRDERVGNFELLTLIFKLLASLERES